MDHQKHCKQVRANLKAKFIPGQHVYQSDRQNNIPCCVFHEDALSFQLHKQLPTCSHHIQNQMYSQLKWRPTFSLC